MTRDGGDEQVPDRAEPSWDVDRAQSPEGYVEYLVANSESALMRRTVAQRLRAHDLAQHRRILDLGCGIGTYARMLAETTAPRGLVTGIDRSRTMLQAARAQPGERVRYVQADAHALPFADASFDLAWVERTLVHLRDPLAALRELRRTLDGGGVALIGEADYEGALLDAPDEALWQLVRERWLARQAQTRLARALPRLLRDAGFTRVELHPELRTIAGVEWMDRAFGLRRRSLELVAEGAAKQGPVDAFWNELEARERAGRFCMLVPFVVASARGACEAGLGAR